MAAGLNDRPAQSDYRRLGCLRSPPTASARRRALAVSAVATAAAHAAAGGGATALRPGRTATRASGRSLAFTRRPLRPQALPTAVAGHRSTAHRPTARPQQQPHPTVEPVQQPLPEAVLPLAEGEDSQESDAPDRQHDFWRWTAGIGWALDALLLGWAIFLRDLGFVSKQGSALKDQSYLDASELGAGGASLKINDATYAELLERELLEERSITESDSQLGSMLEKLKSDLAQLGKRIRGKLTPEETAPADKEEAVLKLSTLEAKMDANRVLLQRRDNVFLGELEGKLETLRSLSARLQKNKAVETRGYSSEVPQPASFGSGNNAELVPFLQGAALPVAFALAASVGVAWLSRQFLRVATAWRREEWSKAEKARKVQLWRLRQLQDRGNHFMSQLGQGKVSEAQSDLGELVDSVGKWAAEPTWEELFRTEAAAFWERWGPQAFELEAVLPGVREAPQEPESTAKWVVDRWWTSAQAVVKDTAETALAAWAGGEKKPAAASEGGQDGQDLAKQAEVGSKEGAQQAHSTGLVIRIFGRWPEALEWVSITNLPLAGDWREKALRLLIPAEKDVRDLPILGPLCESLLTVVVSNQVKRSVTTSVWGGLTTDLWRFRGSQRQFEMGYEVVEVDSQVPEKMCEIARSLPRSGTPGGVVRLHGLEPELEEPET